MKTSLDHLPEHKQDEIKRASSIISDMAKVDMIILFGSYARGDWVEDLQPDGLNMHEYKSDIDLLLVVKHEAISTKIERMASLENRLNHEVKTPVSIIVEDIYFLNKRLSEGQYFYKDILEQGILLFDSGKLTLESPRQLHPNERKQLAIDDFAYWFSNAKNLSDFFTFGLNKEDLNNSAFILHQVAERLYTALLLVFLYYKPNTHDLQKLHKRAASIDTAISLVFPQNTEQEKHLFELLRKAYVDARYKKSYLISKDELQELGLRVKRLEALTQRLCKQKIDSFSELAS